MIRRKVAIETSKMYLKCSFKRLYVELQRGEIGPPFLLLSGHAFLGALSIQRYTKIYFNRATILSIRTKCPHSLWHRTGAL